MNAKTICTTVSQVRLKVMVHVLLLDIVVARTGLVCEQQTMPCVNTNECVSFRFCENLEKGHTPLFNVR